jgi:hypothetical protein
MEPPSGTSEGMSLSTPHIATEACETKGCRDGLVAHGRALRSRPT